MSLRDLGEYHLKDFEQAMRLYQVVIAGLPADFPPLKTQASARLTPCLCRQLRSLDGRMRWRRSGSSCAARMCGW